MVGRFFIFSALFAAFLLTAKIFPPTMKKRRPQASFFIGCSEFSFHRFARRRQTIHQTRCYSRSTADCGNRGHRSSVHLGALKDRHSAGLCAHFLLQLLQDLRIHLPDGLNKVGLHRVVEILSCTGSLLLAANPPAMPTCPPPLPNLLRA